METRPRASSGGVTWARCRDAILDFHLNSDRIFYWIGLSIGTRPWMWLIITLCINCACCPGLLLWKEEVDDVELFMPNNAVVRKDSAWVKEHFRDDLSYENIIVAAPNVLEPEVLRSINEIEQAVKTAVVNNITWHDVCAGFTSWFEDNDVKPDPDDIEFTKQILMHINSAMVKEGCVYQSLLNVWQNNKMKDINNLTKEEVLNDVTREMQQTTSRNILLDITPLLSGVWYDEQGRVKGAKATILNWVLKKSNPQTVEWELEFINRVLHANRTLPPGMRVYALSSRSFKDFLREILDSNLTTLIFGLSLIAVYVMTTIGRYNIVEQRVYLSVMGVSVVGQAILSAYGACFYMGYFYGPIHPILPFMLLGIGVDDMFVIMQSLENLSERDKALDVPLRIAKALQQSGMSITVTSLTNMVAFGIGVTTVMPFLRSFCTFAAMGITFLYVFEVTFFVSCLVYDERRLLKKKEGCCCRTKPNWKPNECSQKSVQQMIFENYVGPCLMKPFAKSIVIIVAVLVVCTNVWAIFQLEQNFDPLWYLNQKSYPIRFSNALKDYFPRYGKRAGIYMSGVDYYEDRESLLQLIDALRNNPFINNRTLEPWFVGYERWLNATNKGEDIEDRDEYYNVLTEYLFFTKEGQGHIKDIKFSKVPSGDYNITTSQIPIQHVLINTTANQIHAMQSIRESIQATNLSQGQSHVAIFSPDYVSWTANQIIGEELIRNLSLEILAIGLVSILLLRNFQSSFWVICCVLFTIIDLLGSMYFLNLTVEMSSSITILLCAGLAVDYAAHIGLEFTRVTGTKNERAIATLSIMGPPVFNGGLSTFLAFVLLGFSEAYLFTTFFKLFTAVVVFGLFHGLIFLPVILSILGPNERKRGKTKAEHIVPEQNGYFTVHLSSNEKDAVTGLDK